VTAVLGPPPAPVKRGFPRKCTCARKKLTRAATDGAGPPATGGGVHA